MNSSDSVTGEGLQATRLSYGREEVLMSSDIDARIARSLDQLEDLSLPDAERQKAKDNLTTLQDMKRA